MHKDEIVGRVRNALAHEPGLEAPNIMVTFLGPEVALGGIVDSAKQALLAVEAARQAVPEVPIENDLTVAESHHDHGHRDLVEAVQAVVAATVARLQDSALQVNVEVVGGGVVRLHGKCSTHAQRLDLVVAVLPIPGVRDVRADGLRVARAATPTHLPGAQEDTRLEREIRLAFGGAQLPVPNLQILVKGGEAHISGYVAFLDQQVSIGRVARQVRGIIRVHNKVTLLP
jgi:osmotically-inducible protein OsmY